jgi:prolyl 4-hydroxylase
MNSWVIVILIFIVVYILIMNSTNTQSNIITDSIPYPLYIKSTTDYQVKIISALTKLECQEIIELAKKEKMSESRVVSENSLSEYNDNARKSYQIWFHPSRNPILQKLSKLSTELTGFPQNNQELVQIVKYEEGGKFDAHYDSCVQNESICKGMNKGAGQRRSTLLVYLNEEIEGGETEFVNIDQKIKPETGKAILFYSTDDQERVITESTHRGCPVTKGEKWIATIWSHSLPYPN